jgi:hypothetical protein
MPKRKQMSNTRRSDLVRRARAGVISESDNIANEIRVRTNHTARIIRAAKTHLGSVTRVSDEQAITDILADLHHYCDVKGLAFRKFHAVAYALYMEDKAYEAEWPGLSTPSNR